MKVNFRCIHCLNDYSNYNISLTDENIYQINCPNGHETFVSFYIMKFEILFENALISFKENRYREAVLNAASSLERFNEFLIQFLYGCNYQHQTLFEEKMKKFEKVFKLLKYSERQIGAYSILYSLFFFEDPKVLSQSNIELRNNVVHNGKFPSMEEAEKFLKQVVLIIRDTTLIMKEYNQTIFSSVYKYNLDKYFENYTDIVSKRVYILEKFGLRLDTQSIDEIRDITFESLIKNYAKKTYYTTD